MEGGPPCAATSGSADDEGARVDLSLALGERLADHVLAAATAVGLTPMQARLLRSLDEPRPMQHVACQLRCDPSNVTGLIDRLERRRLVERRTDPADRRVRWLCLTDDGRRVRDDLFRRLATGLPPFAGLGGADADRLAALVERALGAAPPAPGG